MLLRFLLSLAPVLLMAQPEGWTRPFPAHKIAGNVYYVGTEDLACYLIATPKGHILINTGLADSTPLLRDSIRQTGHKLEDIRILLIMQAHYDHTAALAEVQRLSGAKMFVTAADAPAMENGGKEDPIQQKSPFAPVKVDRRLKHGDKVSLGGTELTVIVMPGHTKGSVSYSLQVDDGGRKRSMLIANLPSVVMPLVRNEWYPGIVADYEVAFERLKALSPEIWVAGHASQYDMARKLKAGSFVDPEGYRQAVAQYEQLFRERLAKEQAR